VGSSVCELIKLEINRIIRNAVNKVFIDNPLMFQYLVEVDLQLGI
jgi:hypothetical protein